MDISLISLIFHGFPCIKQVFCTNNVVFSVCFWFVHCWLLILLCVFECWFSKTLCFTRVWSEFFTTASNINFEMLILLCFCEGHVSKTLCFTGVGSDFLTTGPSINLQMLIIPVFLMVIVQKHCAHHQKVTAAAPRCGPASTPIGNNMCILFYPTRTLQCETLALLGNILII